MDAASGAYATGLHAGSRPSPGVVRVVTMVEFAALSLYETDLREISATCSYLGIFSKIFDESSLKFGKLHAISLPLLLIEKTTT